MKEALEEQLKKLAELNLKIMECATRDISESQEKETMISEETLTMISLSDKIVNTICSCYCSL